ncbi:AI-2E family transporter [Novosphingobium sp. TH158]|uniref:AI-2E family transporter n=1 Tax=Novosphingobium sp. TH158 TaxID=2067455 RepID=UPI000C7E6AC9|nr:AI-2E family transporter [Novosphingobium sp. TH158]PLK26045.1 AI-2E family transporter [Novosphingobium sp. TH158]
MKDRHLHGWTLEDVGFAALVVFVTVLFGWMLLPYFGAILWGLVAAILFRPLHLRLVAALGGRKGTAAGITLFLIVAVVILPAVLLGASLVQEASAIYARIQSGDIDIGRIMNNAVDALPQSLRGIAQDYGIGDPNQMRGALAPGLKNGLQAVAGQALNVGQGALSFIAALGVMLYLTFFLLRDGNELEDRFRTALPIRPQLRDRLIDKFLAVIRATMKGTVAVAVMQGLVGGLIFWMLGVEGALLWGLLMGFLSLIPAVGTGLVWVPVAVYLLITGSVWEGAILVFCGLFVIGLIDNLLRPILVGKDTKLPDFVVLIATVAGLELFGITGFIIGPIIAALFIAVWDMVTHVRGQPLPRHEG